MMIYIIYLSNLLLYIIYHIQMGNSQNINIINFDNIPFDVVEIIFHMMDFRTKLQFSLTAKAYSNLANDDNFLYVNHIEPDYAKKLSAIIAKQKRYNKLNTLIISAKEIVTISRDNGKISLIHLIKLDRRPLYDIVQQCEKEALEDNENDDDPI
jgi:hypothetical protein